MRFCNAIPQACGLVRGRKHRPRATGFSAAMALVVFAFGRRQQAQGTCGFVSLGAQTFDHWAQWMVRGQHSLEIIKCCAQMIFDSDKAQQIEMPTTAPWRVGGLWLNSVIPHCTTQQAHRMPSSGQEACDRRCRRSARDDFQPSQCVVERHGQGYQFCF